MVSGLRLALALISAGSHLGMKDFKMAQSFETPYDKKLIKDINRLQRRLGDLV